MASPNHASELRLLPSGMSFTSGNVAENWERFKQKLEFYFNALTAATCTDSKKIGILMTALGDAGLDIYNSFTNLDKKNCGYAEVIRAFDVYCKPRKNTVYERFVFSQLVQGSRTIDAFLVDLRTQARKCDFFDKEHDKLIRDRLVVGVNDPKVRKQMLRDPDLTLETATTIAKVWEKSDVEAAAIAKSTASSIEPIDVHAFRPSAHNDRSEQKKCGNCGYEHRNPLAKCPAADKECNYCHKMGHFTTVCRKRLAKPNVSAVDTSSTAAADTPSATVAETSPPAKSIEVLQLYALSSRTSSSAWYATIAVQGVPIRFKIDSGAECNTLVTEEFAKLSPRPILHPTSALLRPYGDGQLIEPVGEALVRVFINQHWFRIKVFVIDFSVQATRKIDSILGLPTIEDVGLVKRTFTVSTTPSSKQPIFQSFADVFDGTLGCVAGACTLAVKPTCQPVAEKPRRFAFALKNKLCSALTDLLAADVIARVEEPTEWVSNLIAVTKPNGSLRICLDPKYLNEALIVPKCEIPRSDDIFAELYDKRYFTVFDLKDGFWQLRLDEPSSFLTTFNSPLGRFRWKRLVMGISSAPEIFMNKMRELFGDLKGVYPYFDDLIVAGTDEADHDNNLLGVMQRARQVGVKFNANKVQYKLTTVNYLGFQISQKGVQPLERHLQAIAELPRPTDRNAVLRFLGMVRYLSRFLPDLASNTEALRQLTRKDALFHWLPAHETEFVKLKSQIAAATNLRFYNPADELFVQTDSSKSGVGCCLFQQAAPIAYASRALSKTEQNYAQIEKELLAVVFALEKFHDYTYGRPVIVYSDHKPLVTIVKKPIAELTPRLQRLRLRLLRYNFDLQFQPGKELFVADTLSRAYLLTEPADESYQLLDVHCCSPVVVSPAKLRELTEATTADEDLQRLKGFLRGGWPRSSSRLSPALLKFRTFADQLSIRGEFIFFRERLVVPSSLVPLMLQTLHEGHLNVNKTKQLARNTLFWLGMSADIELFVAACETCNKYRRNNAPESLKSFPIPVRPWQRLHTDILTFNAVNFLVVYDSYSQWLELFTLKTKSIGELIVHFKTLFARFGIPSEIVSDNVPYNSAEWLAFAEAWNFDVLFSSPRYPKANGASEKAVAIAKGILQKNSHTHYALLQYHAAPIPHLGYSPAQLLMGRSLRTRVPVADAHLQPLLVDSTLVHDRKVRQQSRQKFYHDRTARDLPPLQPGDDVYFKKDLADKEWRTGKVTNTGDSPRSYEVTDDQSQARYLRNRRFLRKPARYRVT